MNENFESHKAFLLSLKHEINLLRQHIDYLIRNEKALQLLDLDILMNRTHDIYAMLLSVNVGQDEAEQDIDIDPEAVYGLFEGMTTGKHAEPAENIDDAIENEAENDSAEETEATPEADEPEEEAIGQETDETVAEADEMPESPENETTQDTPEQDEADKETTPTENTDPAIDEHDSKLLGDEFGFFFPFDDTPEEETASEEEKQPEEEVLPEVKDNPIEEAEEDQVVITDDKIVHFVKEINEDEIPERNRVEGDELIHEDPFVVPVAEDGDSEDENPVAENEGPVAENPVQTSTYDNVFSKEENDFEMETPETLGDKMQHEDHSLAAKYRQNTVPSLKSAIGINDKFLFVNELFSGSMEKYNKSIENLDDLMTYKGAIIYLNELKVELQWNSSNVAYQKLTELINRKFNS